MHLARTRSKLASPIAMTETGAENRRSDPAMKRDKKQPTKHPQQPGSRAFAVYRTLRRAIIEQALRPGMKLPEDSIGERLGVSRTLVREALGRLAFEGLVELKPNRGASVASPTLEEARDVFDVRLGLERMVVAGLAGQLTTEQLARLEDHVRQESDVQGRDGPESIRLAGEFHTLLADMTGNALLSRYIHEVSSRCSLILAIYGRPHSSECAVSEHRQIIDALRDGKAKRAQELMEQHLNAVATRAVLAPRASRDIGDVLATYARSEGLTTP